MFIAGAAEPRHRIASSQFIETLLTVFLSLQDLQQFLRKFKTYKTRPCAMIWQYIVLTFW